MKLSKTFWAVSALAYMAACGGGKEPETASSVSGKGPKNEAGEAVNQAAEDKFQQALDSFNAHDKANDWNDANCSASAAVSTLK